MTSKTPQVSCVPCHGGIPVTSVFNKQTGKNVRTFDDGDKGILKIKHVLKSRPMNLNILAIPSKRYALSSWKMNYNYLAPERLEQLRGIVQGEYMGVNIKNCTNAIYSMRKRRDAARAAEEAANRPAVCGKEDCTMVAMLLHKLKNTNMISERRSLTCIIFNELCKISSIDPSKLSDNKRTVALMVAKKLGVWIDSMLEKKSTITCADMTLNPKSVNLTPEMIECPCMKYKQPDTKNKPEVTPQATGVEEVTPKEKKKGKKGKKKKKF